MRGLYQLKADRAGTILSLPTPAICYQADDFRLVAQHIVHRDVHSKRKLVDRMSGDEFQELADQIEVLSGTVDTAAGRVLDLNIIFDRMSIQSLKTCPF